MNIFTEIVKDHIVYMGRVFHMAKADLVKQYRGAVFSWAWAVVRPAITIFVFWFAFSFGIRKGAPIAGYPFFLWLIAGFVPWFFMRDSITGSAQSIRRYKYLVQKVRYPVDTIPTFVCISNLITNVILMFILLLIFLIFGFTPDIYWLQLPVCYLMALLFFIPFGLLIAMLSAYSKDFLNFIRAMVTALFWMSGIIYDAETVDNGLIRNMLLWNPVTIIVNSFRDALIYHKLVLIDTPEIMYYLIAEVIVIAASCSVYAKLRKKLPDVL